MEKGTKLLMKTVFHYERYDNVCQIHTYGHINTIKIREVYKNCVSVVSVYVFQIKCFDADIMIK